MATVSEMMAMRKPIGEGAEVPVCMGSQSDMPFMQHACSILTDFGVPYAARITSAHRTPDRMRDIAMNAVANGVKAFVAGAGGAAHLPGMLKAYTRIPVFGVPIPLKHTEGIDSLYSIAQMPKGKPVNTMAIGKPGAINGALGAIEGLWFSDRHHHPRIRRNTRLQSGRLQDRGRS